MEKDIDQERKNTMEEKLSVTEDKDPVVEKKTYTPPTVTLYGKLTELTAGGSGRSDEGSHREDKLKHP